MGKLNNKYFSHKKRLFVVIILSVIVLYPLNAPSAIILQMRSYPYQEFPLVYPLLLLYEVQ